MALIFIDKVPGDKAAFDKVVRAIARKYNINPNWLMALMNSETGGTFRADQYNLAGSGAVGLIQFMPSTAKQLGYTTQELANMTNVQQLKVVDEYIEYTMKHVAKVDNIRDYDDLYLLIFYPAAVNEKSSYVIARSPSVTYSQNRGIDGNKDGLLTVEDFREFIRKKIPVTDIWQFVGRHQYSRLYIIGGVVIVITFVGIAIYKGWFKNAWYKIKSA